MITVEFTNHELKALSSCAEGIQLVIDYLDFQETSADAQDYVECSRAAAARRATLELARDAMLAARGESPGTINLMFLTDVRPPTRAVASVLAEKKRIVDVEGYTPELDDAYVDAELAFAGIAYAVHYTLGNQIASDASLCFWPPTWRKELYKPKSPRRNLVRAIALLLCEVERIDRKSAREIPL
jgi:hypothetical protein